jgi:hypothetical protein
MEEGGTPSSPCFQLKKTGHDNHLIFDTLRRTEVLIASGHLKSDGFPLTKWYVEQCYHMDGRRRRRKWPERYHALRTNESTPELIGVLLEIGSPYPGDPESSDLGQQFEVIQSEANRGSYLIMSGDDSTSTFTPLSISNLNNHRQ